MTLNKIIPSIIVMGAAAYAHQAENLSLDYDEPAAQWVEALPLGNGNLGAMVFGGVQEARYQLNEDTLYVGEPHDYSKPNAHKSLEGVRELLFKGEQHKAEYLANTEMMSDPFTQIPYQTLGDIKIKFEGHKDYTNYNRSLNLTDATSVTTYTVGDINYTRTAIASYPDNVIVIKLEADKPGALTFSTELSTPNRNRRISAEGNRINLSGKLVGAFKSVQYRVDRKFENPLRFHAILDLDLDGGSMETVNNTLKVTAANSATITFTADSSYVNYRDVSGDPQAVCESRLKAIDASSWDTLMQRHLEDYQKLFNRVSIDLGSTGQEHKMTNDRLIAASEEDNDPGLASLIYQYGRYLMIACSRAGTQPSNLQGIWNKSNTPPWGSRYTVNINTQMNYWPAEMTNLSECHEPLFAALEDLAESGSITAKNHYNCRGWVLHHNFDLWRGTAPINGANHGLWTTGGAWLCQHLWWHYEYNEDRTFLQRAYPIMKGAAEFFADFLIEDPRNDKGWLISTPSHSPENGGLVAGATMDHQIIRDLFRNVIAASEVLDTDTEFRTQLQSMVPKIAPNQIGQHGQLQEWLEDKDDPNNKHRHVSHLWALHPGEEINWQDTPELFEAAKQSLNFRGDQATGWSMGWKMNFWARFLDGERAKKIYDNFTSVNNVKGISKTKGGLYPNLFCAHPPFQIDGNFGATAGITEMVMQNHIKTQDGTRLIHLLPALPSQWATEGHLTGLKARGGITVDVHWKDGKVTKASFLSVKDQEVPVKVGDETKMISLKANTPFTL